MNPYRCFPQYFKPQVTPAGFHKYVVTSVTERDLSPAGAADEMWAYAYSAEASSDVPPWARDFAETIQLAYRSWILWRGYTDVTTTHGSAGGTQPISRVLYHRGMDGDSLSSWETEQGVEFIVVKDLLGHAQINTTAG
ncbi:MAG: hypothetical protein ACM30G_07705 [Micromonosporaceae bacterium]